MMNYRKLGKVGIIIQARMGSSRLPGKVLKEVDGVPMLLRQIDRLSILGFPIVVATTCEKQDEPIISFCIQNNISCFKGSENDVLKRYLDCANEYKFENIIRVTADCPLIDPFQVMRCYHSYLKTDKEFLTNRGPKTWYPDGIDTEIFTRSLLQKAHSLATDPKEREHVTTYFLENEPFDQLPSGLFDLSHYRYTLDTWEDFAVIEYLIRELKYQKLFGSYEEVIMLLDGKKEYEDGEFFYSSEL